MCFVFQFIADYNGEDRFMTRIGVGGLINLDKVKQAHIVLSDIQMFLQHCQGQITDIKVTEEKDDRFVTLQKLSPSYAEVIFESKRMQRFLKTI